MKCWEYMRCGRIPGGDRVEEFGVCPAFPDHGKSCARVAGTMCWGEVQGTFAAKLTECTRCPFYQSEHYVTIDQLDEILGK